jgi:hypothetical protein
MSPTSLAICSGLWLRHFHEIVYQKRGMSRRVAVAALVNAPDSRATDTGPRLDSSASGDPATYLIIIPSNPHSPPSIQLSIYYHNEANTGLGQAAEAFGRSRP